MTLIAEDDAFIHRKRLEVGARETLNARTLRMGTAKEANNCWKTLDRAERNRTAARAPAGIAGRAIIRDGCHVHPCRRDR
jgi:hypothetical protein